MTCPAGYTAQAITIKEKGSNVNLFACVQG
jgi:hypothetical protein